jgi:hypothetical protein
VAAGPAVGYCCNAMLWNNFTPVPRRAWKAPPRAIAGAKRKR